MGLKWFPLPRPKPSMEAEYEQLLSLDLELLKPAERRRAKDRFEVVTESPVDFLGAAGIASNDFVVALQSLQSLRAPGDVHDQVLTDVASRWSAAKDRDPHGPVLWCPDYSFAGQLLEDVRQVIGKEMLDRAWRVMAAKELREYGLALKAAQERFDRSHAADLAREAGHWAKGSASPRHQSSVIADAAAWCLWWSERGFGLSPDY